MSKKKKIFLFIIISIFILTISISLLLYFNNKITFSIKDTLPDGSGKQATIILLGGQSNASGCSHNEYLEANVSKEQYEEFENGYNNVYINYISGYNASNEFIPCKIGLGELENSFGPELGLAMKLNDTYPDRTFFIIKCAWGGTNLFEQWLSPSSEGKTGKLYKTYIEFVSANIKYIKSKNYDIKIEAMCWMQGESDSFSIENGENYEIRLNNLIKDIRKKFKRYESDNGIAFIDAYIADNPMYWVFCDLVNESKRKVAESSSINTVIDTNALGLSFSTEPKDNPDMAHYDSLSELKLGELFADEVIKFFD